MREGTLAQFRPLGEVVERWTEVQPPAVRAGWAAIPIALWKYRTGEFAQAKEYGRYGLNPAEFTSKSATLRLILAMVCYRSSQESEAREYLAQGRKQVEEKFKLGLNRGDQGVGLWYDWVFARVLLREAEDLIKPVGAAEQ